MSDIFINYVGKDISSTSFIAILLETSDVMSKLTKAKCMKYLLDLLMLALTKRGYEYEIQVSNVYPQLCSCVELSAAV